MSAQGSSEHDRLPEGYTFEMEQGTLVLKDPEGRVIGRFLLTAFGPDPQMLVQLAQDDLCAVAVSDAATMLSVSPGREITGFSINNTSMESSGEEMSRARGKTRTRLKVLWLLLRL